ncbi:hypothetical protein [Sphingomonas edaphi]|uniref:Uncharacterized protein n=1 Tax=Sphingomonas edaphi TaxID=2315689 RepID=A0A418Q3B4_9SPHN|nr:hypothetical protein [Sphingomonas edaphi]RIX32389.1 hypothetical protein D3M59_05450 [Sphingomonas edaphi]
MSALFLIPVVFAWLAGLALLRFGRWTWRPVTRLLRSCAQFLALALVVTGVLAVGFDAEKLGAAQLVLAAHLGWRVWRDRNADLQSVTAGRAAPAASAGPSDWDVFFRSLDRRQRSRAVHARAAIDNFLAVADRTMLNPEQRSLAIALKTRIPELMGACRDRCVTTGTAEQQAYAERTLAVIEQMAVEADDARAEIRDHADREFETLERYFSGFARRRTISP